MLKEKNSQRILSLSDVSHLVRSGSCHVTLLQIKRIGFTKTNLNNPGLEFCLQCITRTRGQRNK